MATLLRLKGKACWLRSLLPLMMGKHVLSVSNNMVYHIRCFDEKRTNSLSIDLASKANYAKKDEVQLKYHNFDRAVFKIDMELKRIGRISRVDVDDLFNQVKRTDGISSSQGLMIIRCCGDCLVESKSSERMELLKNVLDYLKTNDFVFDVSHYNSLLKVYLDNDYEFKPEDIVAEMDKNGIDPNRVTYQRLIARYCKMGDTNRASKVLEVMKAKSLPVNENIFNSLIMGHFRANDMTGVAQVLELMKIANLEPSEDTYTLLISCYAEKGDWENMQTIFSELATKHICLSDGDYLKIVEVLAEKGHIQFIPELLSKMPKLAGCNQELYNSTIRLVNKDQIDVAYNLVQMMFKPFANESERPNSGNFFIRQLVHTKQPIDIITSICKDMEEKEVNSFALIRATEIAMHIDDPDTLLSLFKVLKEEGHPIRSHYFWPIFVHYQKMKNKKGILETLTAFLEFGCKADSDTFIDYVFPVFDSSALEEAVLDIKAIGFSVGYIVSPLLVYLINQQDFNGALEIIDKFHVNYAAFLVIPALSRQCGNMENINDIIKILTFILPNIKRLEEHTRLDYAGQFVLDSFFNNEQNEENLKIILTAMIKHNISMSHDAVEVLQRRLKESATSEIMSLIEKLTLNPRQLPIYHEGDLPPHPRRLSVEDLEAHLIELKNKNMNPRGVLRRLFIENCRLRNYKRVEEIKNELDADGFEYSAGMLALLMDMTVSLGELDKALQIKEEIYTKFSDFIMDDFKIINLATGMVKENRLEDAIELLSSQREKYKVANIPASTDRNLKHLLTAASEKGIEPTRRLLDVVIQNKYSEPTNILLGPLIKAHLLNNDIVAAIAEFEECTKLYKLTPYKTEFFKRFIEMEDADNLQKIMDITIKIHGEMNTLHDLAFAFLEVGRVKQAKKIFETPGLHAKMDKLLRQCNWLVNNNKIDMLENLVNATKDLFEVDRNALYLHLLRGYRKVEDPQKALACWTAMQEENLTPSSEVLRYLAQILQEHQITVPFTVSPTKQPEMKILSDDEEMKNLIHENKLIEALELAKNTKDQSLSILSMSLLIEALLQQNQLAGAINATQCLLETNRYPNLSVLRFLLNKLSLNGDVTTLQLLQKKLPEKIFGFVKMNTHIERALIGSGKEEEILQKWENQDRPLNFYHGSILHLLKKKPEALPRVEMIIDNYAKSGFHKGTSVLWQYYIIKEQFDKAIDLIKKFPELPNHLRVASVCTEAQKNNKPSMLTKLIDILRPLNTSDNLAFAYSYLIGLQCSNHEYDAALLTLEKLKEDNLKPEDLQPVSLNILKKGLEESGKSLPFQLSKQTKKKTVDNEYNSD